MTALNGSIYWSAGSASMSEQGLSGGITIGGVIFKWDA
jgi:hypothetical protein